MGFFRWIRFIACWQLAVMLLLPTITSAQSSDAEEEDDEFVVRDSDVGYIDSAVLGNSLRLRFDAAYDFDRPNRAEFFYAAAQPAGQGLPRPEIAIDYQQYSLYTEYRAHENLSLFIDAGGLALNPELNDNTSGWGDIQSGVKFRLLETSTSLATAQLRVYAPTGDVERGLGTGHTSLEPGLLAMHRVNAYWTASSELRYWTAIGGGPFAGDVLRYGLGLQCSRWERVGIRPVIECVGWTVLDGQQSSVASATDQPVVEDASGDTIVNLKLGSRIQAGPKHDIYVGYGQALTPVTWYNNILRVELRYVF